MGLHHAFQNVVGKEAAKTANRWDEFLQKNNFDFSQVEKIDFANPAPVITDNNKNKFSIDFVNDRKNYHKKKLSMKNELLSKAMGAGRLGLRILDLSAGLGIDAVFLAQLGYEVTAVERNPLIYLCLNEAVSHAPDLKLKFVFSDSLEYLKHNTSSVDVIYFDPMFPEKTKSALPRQEMVFFKQLVGADEDAANVLTEALKARHIKRVVVKRPLKAPPLKQKPSGSLQGKLVRFDIYGVEK